MTRRRLGPTLFTLVALLLATAAMAGPAATSLFAVGVAQPAVAAPDQAGGDGFEPVSSLPPAGRETLPAAPLVMAAYGFVWLMLFGYLWSIWRRVRAVERELTGVARRVDDLQRR